MSAEAEALSFYRFWAYTFAILVGLECAVLFALDRRGEYLAGRNLDLEKQVEALKDDSHPYVLCP